MKLIILLVTFFLFVHPAYASSQVQITKIMAHPTTGEDWIELYNSQNQSVNMTNWTVSDNSSSMKTLTQTLNPQESIQIFLSNRLNNSGDSVILKDSTGLVIDQYTYTSDPGTDICWVQVNTSWQQQNNCQPAPTPTPSPSSSPTPSPTPSTTPSPSPTPSPSATPALPFLFTLQSTSFFTTASQNATVQITGLAANTSYYLKTAFFKEGSTNYFGKILLNGNWVKNSQTYSDQLSVTTDGQGNWQGTVSFMADDEDSGFTGTGDYLLKLGRYSASGNGPTWSPTASVYLTLDQVSEPTPSSSTTSSSTPATTSSQTITTTSSTTAPPGNKKSITTTIPESFSDDILGTASAQATESSEVLSLEDSPPSAPQASSGIPPWPFWIIGITTIAGGTFAYLFKHDTIQAWNTIFNLIKRPNNWLSTLAKS